MKSQLKTQLADMYHAEPKAGPDDISNVIQVIKRENHALTRETSLFWFLRSQVKFTNKRLFVIQFMLICMYSVFILVTLKNIEGFLLLVPAAPLVVLIGTSEVSRSYCYGTAELELPTRFSFRQVLLARMVIITVTDMITFTCLLGLTAWQLHTPVWNLILFCLVPAFLAAFGSLFIMNRFRNAFGQYYINAYCMALVLLGVLSVTQWPAWYEASASVIWLLVFVAVAVGVALESCKLLRDCSRIMDSINKGMVEGNCAWN